MPKISKKSEQNTKITHYFNITTNNINEIPKQNSTVNKSTEFYGACLDSKLACKKEANCHEVILKLENQLASAAQKLEQINKAHLMCLDICKKKDAAIELLQNKIQSQPCTRANTTSEAKNNEPTTSQSDEKKILFEKYKGVLGEVQLSKLRSIDIGRSGDSSFILNAVRFIYSENLAKLKNKSVTGCTKTKKTEAMSPEKLDQLRSLYNERIIHINEPKDERNDRLNKFNRLVGRAIANINVQTNKEEK